VEAARTYDPGHGRLKVVLAAPLASVVAVVGLKVAVQFAGPLCCENVTVAPATATPFASLNVQMSVVPWMLHVEVPWAT
jgi:hypothetical protein